MEPAKDRVRKAAVHLFATKGFHGTGIRDLAEAAGLSSASLYHYMGTKEDLLVSIMCASLERLCRSGAEVVRSSDAPLPRLGRLVHLHVLTHALLQEETMVVDNELRALSPKPRRLVLGMRDEYEGLWRDAIEDGCTSGTFNVPDAGLARLGLLELCTGVAKWYSPKGAVPLTDVAQAHAQMAFAMLGVRPRRGRRLADEVPAVEPSLRMVAEVWGLKVR